MHGLKKVGAKGLLSMDQTVPSAPRRVYARLLKTAKMVQPNHIHVGQQGPHTGYAHHG